MGRVVLLVSDGIVSQVGYYIFPVVLVLVGVLLVFGGFSEIRSSIGPKILDSAGRHGR